MTPGPRGDGSCRSWVATVMVPWSSTAARSPAGQTMSWPRWTGMGTRTADRRSRERKGLQPTDPVQSTAPFEARAAGRDVAPMRLHALAWTHAVSGDRPDGNAAVERFAPRRTGRPVPAHPVLAMLVRRNGPGMRSRCCPWQRPDGRAVCLKAGRPHHELSIRVQRAPVPVSCRSRQIKRHAMHPGMPLPCAWPGLSWPRTRWSPSLCAGVRVGGPATAATIRGLISS